MTRGDALDGLEAAYLDARDARDRLDVARARGEPADTGDLEARAAAAASRVRATLGALGDDAEATASDADALDPDDRRALEAIRAGIATALADDAALPVAPPDDPALCDDPAAWASAIEAGDDELRHRLEACYAARAAALLTGDGTLSRLQVLARLGTAPDAGRRRRLFLALEPLWRAVDGDGGPASPYRALVRESARAWAAGRSPIDANARALGVTAGDVEGWAVAALDAWRRAVVEPARAAGEPPIEPWDWWWAAGAAERALAGALPLERIHALDRELHAGLGADLEALGVRFDTAPRPSRPPIPVAFTTFGGRPRTGRDGRWSPGEPWVLATYVDGGLGELVELVHETGHAIHIAGIRTRPAFADWPDSDALTEALAELVSLDLAEPAWRRRWLSDAPRVDERTGIRGRYADVLLDCAWALLEIRLHADPERPPNDAWTEITSRDLGIAPHPEWSWWALRGQLVQEPGYMANYAIGAVLATDLRAAIRAARGDWTAGDPGWYAWVRERIYRHGLGRPSGRVVADVLGRPPAPDALVAQIERARA